MTAALIQSPSRPVMTFTPRLDLRTGLTAAVRAQTSTSTVTVEAFTSIAQDALVLWRVCRRTAPLALPVPAALALDCDALDALLRGLGGDPQRLILEFDEAAIEEAGLDAARRLRARRWSLALRAAAGAPLALNARDRALFAEYLVDVSGGLPAFVGLFQTDNTPLSLRLQAAKAGGATITAIGIDNHLGRRRAYQIGFDRGEDQCGRAAGRAL